MARQWTKPDPIEMRKAVIEAIADLESMEREIQSAEKSHTTGARLLRAEYWGNLAAARKRLAEVQFLSRQDEWRLTLRSALNDYLKGMQQGNVDHWVLGQYLVLRTVLHETPVNVDPTKSPDHWWDEATWAVKIGLEASDPQEQMWASS
jgi:hypothetical protein